MGIRRAHVVLMCRMIQSYCFIQSMTGLISKDNYNQQTGKYYGDRVRRGLSCHDFSCVVVPPAHGRAYIGFGRVQRTRPTSTTGQPHACAG